MEDEIKDFGNDENENSSSAEAETKSAISADLIRGHINTIILRTLYERDKYGYEIIDEIEAKSHGQYSLKQPTLYSALKRLENQGYINAYWKTDEVSQGGRRKYYTLTDSGREMTERNQAEWEYSRTVIDSLISDRNFDFTQPPPTAVDFKILKESTSRVPVIKTTEREVNYDEPNAEHVVEIKRESSVTNLVTEEDSDKLQAVEDTSDEIVREAAQIIDDPDIASQTKPPVEEQTAAVPETHTEMSEEQKRIVHENYLRLISEPVREPAESGETPYADSIITERLIYNNRPDTERDYRNLINNLFVKTVQPDTAQSAPVQVVEQHTPRTETIRVEDATAKANRDGLTVETSEFVVTTGNRRKRYNRGATLFKCSLIIGVVMLLEFALCLIFHNDLSVGLGYPFVILALALAQLLIFGVLFYTDLGKSSRKPTSLLYLTSCIILAIISIVIIFIVAVLLNINFSSIGEIMALIGVPSIVALNIPAFALIFYLLSK